MSHKSNPQISRVLRTTHIFPAVKSTSKLALTLKCRAHSAPLLMCASVSQPPRLELSQHWTALVSMPKLIVTILTAAVTYHQTLALGEGRSVFSPTYGMAAEPSTGLLVPTVSPKCFLAHNRKADKAKNICHIRGVEVMVLLIFFPS